LIVRYVIYGWTYIPVSKMIENFRNTWTERRIHCRRGWPGSDCRFCWHSSLKFYRKNWKIKTFFSKNHSTFGLNNIYSALFVKFCKLIHHYNLLIQQIQIKYMTNFVWHHYGTIAERAKSEGVIFINLSKSFTSSDRKK